MNKTRTEPCRSRAFTIRWRACFLAGCAFAVAALCEAKNETPPLGDTDDPMVRIILSTSTISGASVNDVISAFRIWTYELSKDLDLTVADDVLVLSRVEDIVRELESNPNHLVSMSIPEYLNCGSERFSEKIYLGEIDGIFGTRYLLLVRDDGPIVELGDLGGKKLVSYVNRETSISEEWFQYQLMQADLKPAGELLQSYSMEEDLSKTVLGVFFGNQDACLVSERSFNLMCELNPQLKVQLRVLLQSPEVVGGAMFIQANYDPELEPLLDEGIETLDKKVSGQQIRTLFRSGAVHASDVSELEETIGLYQKWIQSGGDAI
ncbi:MAG: PhnD/SsuA/transferrin family substrate-binding protein [Opitutaceae bacterium]